MARNSKDLTNIPTKSVVVYDDVVTNLGNGYDASTGVFTAPLDGVYQLLWTSLVYHGKNFYTYLTLNEILVARNYASANSASDHASATQCVVIFMKTNDKVEIKIQDGYTGQYLYGGGWSSFSGFRL